MRPTRLELEGFASFRHRAELDLGDAELFVLAGPTGAGKSSLVDAIVFSLYGSVPRYGTRLVEPVINQASNEARVQLTFDVAGTSYRATRVVKRTRNGATTKEASLERLDGDTSEVLAGNAKDVSDAVARLVGLGYEQFVRSVVLPQGDFASFLHATPGERQDLLVRLLALDVYERVARAAHAREVRASATAAQLQSRLDGDLAAATTDALTDAQARQAELEVLATEGERVRDELAGIREKGTGLRAEATQAAKRRDTTAAVQPPVGAAALADELEAAHTARDAADRNAAAAADARTQAEEEAARRPDPSQVRQLVELLERVPLLEEGNLAAQARRGVAGELAMAAAAALDREVESLRKAQDDLATAQRSDAAAAAAEGLHAGDPCPVCGRALEDDPHLAAGAMADARAAVTAAEQTCQAAEQERREAERAQVVAEESARTAERDLAAGQAAIAELADQVAVPANLQATRQALEDAHAAGAALEQARQDERAALDARTNAAEALAAVDRRMGDLRIALERALGELRSVGLEPPAPDGDVAVAWGSLVAWCESQTDALEREASVAQAAVTAAEEAYRDALVAFRERARMVGVEVGDDPAAPCLVALEGQRHHVKRIEEAIAQADQARTELASASRAALVAHDLRIHLDARHFEAWLLSRAARRLAAGASTILRELTDGAYALALGEKAEFVVVDHGNAGQRRPATSLSGGETFLASLALALALADHVAELAAGSTAVLECLILDEGFGTLDPDSLELVTSALEELGTRGRMVGVITHVRELADRLPVRFDVHKQAGTSIVRRRQE